MRSPAYLFQRALDQGHFPHHLQAGSAAKNHVRLVPLAAAREDFEVFARVRALDDVDIGYDFFVDIVAGEQCRSRI